MSRLRAIKHLLATSSGGGGGGTPSVFDSRFGTDTASAASTGWFTFTPNATNYTVWLDANQADDTGDGFTAATAKKTLYAATRQVWVNCPVGTQAIVRIAGTGGRSYVDTGAYDFSAKGGISTAYPCLAQSYDPADPSNTAKYGRLLGADRPRIDMAGSSVSSFGASGNSTNGNYYVWQGLEFFTSTDAEGSIVSWGGTHIGIAVQNCHFARLRLAMPPGSVQNISKSVLYGAWASSGNFSNIFSFDPVDGQIVEDCFIDHGGWRYQANRDDPYAIGGVLVGGWGHGEYYKNSNTNGVRRRITYCDNAADGRNYRGDLISAYCLISWDEPYGAVIGGYSGSYTETPLGTKIVGADWVTIGNALMTSSNPGQGAGFNSNNTQSGTQIDNIALFDAQYNTTQVLASVHAEDAGQAPNYLALTNVRAHNYPNGTLVSASGTATLAQQHLSVTNSITDTAFSDPNATFSGNKIWGSGGAPAAPTNATRSYILTQMGFTGATLNEQKAAAKNWMMEYPHLDWYTPMCTLALQVMGLSPTQFTGSTTLPTTTGLTAPRTIYGTSYTGMAWVGGTSFVHSTPASGTITGVPAGWVVWGTGLPTGLTIDSRTRTWTWDSTQATPAHSSFTLSCGMPSCNPYTITVSY